VAITRVTPIVWAEDALALADWYAPMGLERGIVHEFEPGTPTVVTLRAGDQWLFVSEHEGDARPDTLVYLHVEDAAAVDAVARAYGAEARLWEWDMYEVHLTDPAGNRVRVGSGP
jgi:hypothetical protein